MQKIITSLWFDTQGLEAAEFYCSLFQDSRVTRVLRYGPAGPGEEGTVMTADFVLAGQEFNAINGGPQYKFTEATSLLVNCDSQAEVDRLWAALTADGGEEVQCGWLRDRYGLSWQITPPGLVDLIADPDPARAQRATAAMLEMVKLDIDEIRRAADAA